MTSREPEPARTSAASTPLTLRPPVAEDGRRVHAAVQAWGGLDVNSPYAYLLVCDRFAAQSVLAEREGELLGFVMGLALPESRATLFVWQVAVSPRARGLGVGAQLLDHLVARDRESVRFVEAHVGDHNLASERLFQGLARRNGAAFQASDAYPAAWFPAGHDAERLVRVGPLPFPGRAPNAAPTPHEQE